MTLKNTSRPVHSVYNFQLSSVVVKISNISKAILNYFQVFIYTINDRT